MPIEIKELHVRLALTPPESLAPNATALPDETETANSNDEIVAECVEKVLAILQNKRER